MTIRLPICVATGALCAALACAAWAAPKIIENFPSGAQPGAGAPGAARSQLAAAAGPRVVGRPTVWEMPQIQGRLVQLRTTAAALFQQGKFAEAEQVCRQSVQLIPHDAAGYYFLAATQGRQGKNDEAIASLSKAVDLGFNKSEIIQRDASFAGLQEDLRFAELIAAASIAEPEPNPWSRRIHPMAVQEGQAVVSAGNTGWDAQHGLFISVFRLPEKDDGEPIKGGPPIGEKINQWYREGTAAGNHGDYYDNHDGGHSSPRLSLFPQVTKIRFDEEARRRNFHSGLQTRFMYNGIVIGNSSTALVGNPYWRSQARLAYVDKRSTALLYLQYVKNHLYVYPEHRDHDREHGDVFPANTPYVIVTQGSSWSDKPALEAMFYTLAALRPEVKEFLAKNGALMPTLQLIARTCHNNVREMDDYLTGKAHPTVFAAGRFNVPRMVESARSLKKEAVPPLVRLAVVEDDPSRVGRDYFDVADRQELFTTPCAIARVHRTTNYNYRMVVSAQGSVDLNGRDLKYHWRVLRGDPDKITIKPLNDDGSEVELVVGWQPKQPIQPGSAMQSNRVDIGCFVHNGVYYSAPAFVTFFTLANERREYERGGRVAWVEYKDADSGGDYVDPLVDTPKTWKDVYHYDEAGRLVGWTRQRSDSQEHFTADGALVVERDEQGRPTRARTVKYAAHQHDPKQPAVLVQSPGDELLHYEYASTDDRRGEAIKREPWPFD